MIKKKKFIYSRATTAEEWQNQIDCLWRSWCGSSCLWRKSSHYGQIYCVQVRF